MARHGIFPAVRKPKRLHLKPVVERVLVADAIPSASSGMNSCFFVLSRVTDDKYLGRYKLFGASGSEGYPSRAEAEAAAKRSAAETYTNIPDRIHHVGTIELVECSGVE